MSHGKATQARADLRVEHLNQLEVFRRPGKKHPKTARGRATRAKMMSAAREVFGQSGYSGARVVDIVSRAEVAFGTFYSYFSDKDDVLAALLEPVVEELFIATRAPYLDAEDPQTVVRDAIQRYTDIYWEYRDLMRVLIEATTLDSRFADVWFEIRSCFLARIVRNIERAQAMGMAAPMNPVLEASALGGMVEAFCWVWFAMGGERQHGRRLASPADRDEMVDVLAKLWSAGIFSSGYERGQVARASDVAQGASQSGSAQR